MLALLADPQAWLAFLTLTVLEIVLGVDNVVVLSVLVSRLPAPGRDRARVAGLALAMVARIGLLFSITWLMGLQSKAVTLFDVDLSVGGLVLIAGGVFLLGKGTMEIHAALDGNGGASSLRPGQALPAVVAQIAVIDLVFSLDSVFAAVGLGQRFVIMVAAIVLAIVVTMFLARAVGELIARYPSIKMLALAFLLLIAVALIADGLRFHIPRGYLYFAMAFSFVVELLNVWRRSRAAPTREGRSR